MTTPNSPRSPEVLGNEIEKFIVQLNEQRFNQIAGLPFDKDAMNRVSEVLVNLCSEFLNTYNEPRSSFLNCIALIAQARKLPVTLEIYEKRISVIRSGQYNIRDRPVDWGSWRQFNVLNSNSDDRKNLFDEFITKATLIAPLMEKRFQISNQVYSLYGSSPLEAYLEKELFSYEKLTDLVNLLGDLARKPFLSASDHFAPDVLNKDSFEYYDDFYVTRGRIYSPINQYFEKKNPLKIIEKVLTNWGFGKDISQIEIDSKDRQKKSPSAFCIGIQIPDDIRVVYKHVSPFSDFTSVFHEFGHAIHGTSGNRDDSYWKRYLVPMSVAETFSIFVELLLQNPIFLKQQLDLSEEAVEEIVNRRHFINLYFLVFYSANALMKLEYWKRGYSFESASERYQELTKKFFWEMPGEYWLLHHIMPQYDLYSPSYLLASIRAKEWMDQMIKEYGVDFWCSREAGDVFRDLAAMRGDFDLSVWDLNPKPYLKEQSTFSFF
ncbi:MAG: M3 family metallopeptidase [Candidatus Hodarchaeales archaeon]|jgi:hypothetical protein